MGGPGCADTGSSCGSHCDGPDTIALLSVLGPGEHRFVVDSLARLPVEITVIALSIPPGVVADEVPPSTSSFDGVLVPGGASAGACGSAGSEHIYYWLECATSGGRVTATLCTGGSTFEAMLGLYRSGDLVNCGAQAAGCDSGGGVGVDQIAGLYTLHVAARDAAAGGTYTLLVDRGP